MKSFFLRLSLAAAMTFCAIVLAGSAKAQEPSTQDPAATAPPQQQSPPTAQDPAQQAPSNRAQEPTARPQQDPNEPPTSERQNEPQMPAAGADAQTQDAKTFSGRVVKEDGKIVLKDPITKTSYQVDDTSKLKQFMGKQVKVSGKLDVNSNTIHVESVEPIS